MTHWYNWTTSSHPQQRLPQDEIGEFYKVVHIDNTQHCTSQVQFLGVPYRTLRLTNHLQETPLAPLPVLSSYTALRAVAAVKGPTLCCASASHASCSQGFFWHRGENLLRVHTCTIWACEVLSPGRMKLGWLGNETQRTNPSPFSSPSESPEMHFMQFHWDCGTLWTLKSASLTLTPWN